VNPKTPIVAFSPSVASNAFNQPKKRAYPPKKIVADLFELSSGSGSEEDEANVYKLDDAVKRFVGEDDGISHDCENDGDDDDDEGDDEAMVQDFNKLMKTFNDDDDVDGEDNDDSTTQGYALLMETFNAKINANNSDSDHDNNEDNQDNAIKEFDK
jgi:hypothetical protein